MNNKILRCPTCGKFVEGVITTEFVPTDQLSPRDAFGVRSIFRVPRQCPFCYGEMKKAIEEFSAAVLRDFALPFPFQSDESSRAEQERRRAE